MIYPTFMTQALGHRISEKEFVLSTYAHMMMPSPCPVGSHINRGDVVGLIDHTGKSEGSHLHFEIAKQSRVTVDKDTREIKVQVGDIKIKETGEIVGVTGWYWTKGLGTDSINEYYYHPSNFIKNIMEKNSWEFNFRINENTEGWVAHNVKKYGVYGEVDDGIFQIEGSTLDSNKKYDPYIESQPLSINANDVDTIELRLSSNAANKKGVIYFKTFQEDFYSDDKRVEFTVNNDSNYWTYPIYLAKNRDKWQGIITGIRIDPSNDTSENPEADLIKIDFIRLIKSPSINPVVKITSPPSGSGPAGTSFEFHGSGFRQNYTFTSHLKNPNGIEFLVQQSNTDSQGNANYAFNSTGYAPGDYEYWAIDDFSGKASNTVTFTVTSVASNHPPETPSIPAGPGYGHVGTDYSFSTSTSDQDGDAIEYQYDWGDGNISAWGSSTQNHIWSTAGTFNIMTQARDEHGATSSWSSEKIIAISISGVESSWPMVGHDPQRTGRSSYLGPQTNNVNWAFTLPSVLFSAYETQPIISSDGTIYLGGRGENWTTAIYAISSDGSLRWKSNIGTNPNTNATPCAIGPDGTIYVKRHINCCPPTTGYILYALDPNGTTKWTFDQSNFIDLNYFSTETLFHPESIEVLDVNIDQAGSIYIKVRKFSQTYSLPDYNLIESEISYYLFSLNLDGTFKWMYTFGSNFSAGNPMAIGHDRNVYIMIHNSESNRDELVVFDPDGSMKWSKKLENAWLSSLSIGRDGTIYINGPTLIALAPNGDILWERPVAGYYSVGMNPVIGVDSVVLVTKLASGGSIQAFDFSGNSRWTFYFEVDSWYFQPVMDRAGNVYFSAADTEKRIFRTYALNSDGTLKWIYDHNFFGFAIGLNNEIYALDYESLYSFTDMPQPSVRLVK